MHNKARIAELSWQDLYEIAITQQTDLADKQRTIKSLAAILVASLTVNVCTLLVMWMTLFW